MRPGRALAEMWLRQPGAGTRLALARTTTGLVALTMVARMPSGRLVAEQEELLRDAGQQRPWGFLTPARYRAARVVAAASLAAWTLGVEHPAVKVAANASFGAAQRHLAALHEDLWSYTVNVNAYLLVLSAVDSRFPGPGRGSTGPEASAVLAAMQAYYAMVYQQSGVSKLQASGLSWLDGRTVLGSWSELGTPLGRALARHGRPLAAAASLGTIAFETGFLPALLAAWPQRRWLGVASLGFHAAVRATMGISFWHHSVFALPLFVLPAGDDKANG